MRTVRSCGVEGIGSLKHVILFAPSSPAPGLKGLEHPLKTSVPPHKWVCVRGGVTKQGNLLSPLESQCYWIDLGDRPLVHSSGSAGVGRWGASPMWRRTMPRSSRAMARATVTAETKHQNIT